MNAASTPSPDGEAIPRARHTSTSFSRAQTPSETADEVLRILKHLSGPPSTLFAFQNGLCFHSLELSMLPDGTVLGWVSPALVFGRGPDAAQPALDWLFDEGWDAFPSRHDDGELCDKVKPYVIGRCEWCSPPPGFDVEWCCSPDFGRRWPPGTPLDEVVDEALSAFTVVLAGPPLWLHYTALHHEERGKAAKVDLRGVLRMARGSAGCIAHRPDERGEV